MMSFSVQHLWTRTSVIAKFPVLRLGTILKYLIQGFPTLAPPMHLHWMATMTTSSTKGSVICPGCMSILFV